MHAVYFFPVALAPGFVVDGFDPQPAAASVRPATVTMRPSLIPRAGRKTISPFPNVIIAASR
jgi:hypothetical protein